MKKHITKIVGVVLALTMVFSGFSAVGASAASSIGDSLTHVGVSVLDGIVTALLTGLNAIVPDNKNFVNVSDYKNEYFYEGTDTMLDAPAANAAWHLGYAKASLVPADWQTKDYYLGGFISIENGMSNKVEEVIDDMQARVIAVSDGSGRGISIFANIDSIGFANGDIKTIRKYLEEMDLGVEINSINVSSTHCHSCIDTQGLWTDLFSKLGKNFIKSYLPFTEMENGVDGEFIEFLCRTVAETMKRAVNDMKVGTMSYAVKTLNGGYFNNKNRKSSTAEMYDMTRLIFRPLNPNATPTMLVNIAAHPDIAGLAVNDRDNGRQLSGDYVYYLGETIEQAGYNFMFVNGAIAGIYAGRGLTNDNVPMERRYEQSARYGREMGNIALNLTNTYDYINAHADWDTINKEMQAAGESYTLWFEDWTPVSEVLLAPVLNIKLSTARIKVTNPLIKLVAKLQLANYAVIKDGCNYYIDTEIGYMEMGKLKVALMPGEIVQDLVAGGGSLTAEGSYTGKDFGYKTIRELFGEDTICFGLMNDAIGYVVPDNDYSLAIVDDHYQELISLGKVTASSIMKAFAELAKSL